MIATVREERLIAERNSEDGVVVCISWKKLDTFYYCRMAEDHATVRWLIGFQYFCHILL